ncbi:MAG: MmcQ/YjbR family DNA-binding protein [Actinobacteria bacterium]|nr:MmcQ/YjbR family DNA-binding protein [Actinomycetota bacterium]MBV9664459.1 MmcQ/YjbR family DNA-binding protein [Actinomycetota bacterium]MBV9934636.1 MmcQ/YjbR family DNA-binding protein [Actinomycetota bacterium]
MARPTARACKSKLERICARLPEVEMDTGGVDNRHAVYKIRNKNFAWFTDDHHGDGRLGLHLKAAPGEQETLMNTDAERYFVPPYLGPRGWVGVWLDRDDVDWAEVAELMTEAYRLTAPKRLAATLD